MEIYFEDLLLTYVSSFKRSLQVSQTWSYNWTEIYLVIYSATRSPLRILIQKNIGTGKRSFNYTLIYALYTNHEVIVVDNVFSFGYWGVSRVILQIIFALNVITHWIIRISIWNFRNTLIYALYTNHEVIMVENVFNFDYWSVSRVIIPIIFALNVITHWIIRISIWNFRNTLIYAFYTNHEVIVVENVFNFDYWSVSRVIIPIIFALNVITHWIIRISIWNFRNTLIYAFYTNHEVIVVENVFNFGYWSVSRVISPVIFALNVITHWIIRI